MGVPVVIDTDMGGDDAVAIALALAARSLDVVAVVSVAGNIDLAQATENIGRLLQAIGPSVWPRVGRGVDRTVTGQVDGRWLFGEDGLGNSGLTPAAGLAVSPALDLYGEMIDRYGKDLVIVAIGPLTNLAGLFECDGQIPGRIGRVVVMGGAIWCPGNVQKQAEFNFHRDGEAASVVLRSGVPVTLVPLDVARQVVLDEAHRARLAASGTRAGLFLDQVLAFPLAQDKELGVGRMLVADALAVGSLLWPGLFMQTHIAIDVDTKGAVPGRTRPGVGKSSADRADVLVSVKAVDFLENMLELLCQERFVV